MIDKIIKLCEHICSGNYPINDLLVILDSRLYINDFSILLKEKEHSLFASNRVGKVHIYNISDLDMNRLRLRFSQVKAYSEKLLKDSLDEAIKETIKINNLNDLNFDEQ